MLSTFSKLLLLITTLCIVDGYNSLEVLLSSWPQWLSCVNDFHILTTREKGFPSLRGINIDAWQRLFTEQRHISKKNYQDDSEITAELR